MITKQLKIKAQVIIVILIMFATIFTAVAFNGNVAEAQEKLTSETARLNEVLDRYVSGMSSEYHTNVKRQKTKNLQDFAGNEYTLIECNPTGYMIWCNDSATMVEYAASSPSPYKEYDNNLYYCGPTNFYVKISENEFLHTITGEKLIKGVNTKSYGDTYYDLSNKLHSALTEDVDYTTLNYIKNGIETKANIGLYGETWTALGNAAFFRNKRSSTQIGYYNGGYCGYIAANMLIGYYDTFEKECMKDFHMSGSGVNRHFTGSTLTQELIRFSRAFGWDPDGGSTSTTIRKTMNKYFEVYNYDLGSFDMITPFFSGTTLKNYIDDGIPSILFGNLGDATTPTGGTSSGGNHAVVIYGYKKGGYNTGYAFLAHYGWAGYSESTINYKSYSVFGSMYRISL